MHAHNGRTNVHTHINPHKYAVKPYGIHFELLEFHVQLKPKQMLPPLWLLDDFGSPHDNHLFRYW